MPRIPQRDTSVRSLLIASLFLLLLASLPSGPNSFWNDLRPTASAANFTVNSTGDGADNNLADGICNDGTGACTLRAAIQQANALNDSDTISFSITGTINLTGALPSILGQTTINGPGSSLLTVRRDTGGDYRILSTSNSTVSISGLTVTNGKTPNGAVGSDNGQPGGDGGGILQSGGVLNLNDVVVAGNRTGDGGDATGGSTSFGGRGGFGGGISASGTLTMTNCIVSNNTTGKGGVSGYSGTGGYAGGIYLNTGTVTLANVTISGNHTGDAGTPINSGLASGNSGYGGGIYSQSATLTLTNVTIDSNVIGNVIRGDSGAGGGLFIYSGAVSMTNSTVRNNRTGSATGFLTSGGYGGGIANFGTLTVTGSTISGNSTGNSDAFGSGNSGGGISSGFILRITNSTISGNTTGSGNSNAGSGGGIISSTTLTMVNCTVTGNSAFDNKGPGVWAGDTSSINVRNSLIGANGPAGVSDVFGPFNSQGHNLVGKSDGSNGFTNGSNGDQVGSLASPIDPLVGPLANNGGLTLTHALLPASPALDAADNCVGQAAHCNDSNIPQLTTDQRGAGFSRMVDGPDADATATVDIGAFEQQASLADIADTSTNEDTQLVVPFDVGDRSTITSITVSSSNPTLVPNDSAHLTVADAGTTDVITINPASNLFGSTDITVTVNRSGGGGSSKTFSVTVNSVNDAPSFTQGADQTVNENGGAQTVNGWATNISPGAPNESAQALTFQVTNNSNASLFSAGPAISPSGVLTYAPAPGVSGSATITLSLKDDGGTANGGTDVSPAKTFNITVREGGTISLTSSNFNVTETIGTIAITVGRTGGSAGTASVLFTTSDGTATSADYTSVLQTVTFNDGETSKTVNVPITDDLFKESNETINITLSNVAGSAQLGGQSTAVITISDNDPAGGYLRFSTDNYNASESGGLATITVQRIGETAPAVNVSYATTGGSTAPCSTANGGASSRCDFTLALGTLRFAPGDTSKTFTVLISQDSYVEGPETLTISLSNPTGGAAFATPSTSVLTIADDATEPATNPIDNVNNFVRQHYLDFLNREPDAPGLAYWANQITECQQPGATCDANLRRINVSAAFFLSIEFQETGYLVERLYKTAYADANGLSQLDTFPVAHAIKVPIIRLNEFLPDSQEIGRNLVVGTPGWDQVLENNKVAFILGFVQRSRFTNAFPASLTPTQFVDRLFANAGVTPTTAERTAAINQFGGAFNTADTAARGRALRLVAENPTLNQNERNRAFVLMQYFGYLRRNPDDPQDTNHTGFDFWLHKLDQFNGNFEQAQMVQAFIESIEYRTRFAP